MKKKIITAGQIEVHKKECKFCGDPLDELSHKLRRFCPHKHGIPNWCKHQFKQLVNQAELAGEIVIKNLRDDPGEDPPISIKQEMRKKDLACNHKVVNELENETLQIKENTKQSISPEEKIIGENKKLKIIKIIADLLIERKEREISIDEFVKLGYDPDIYDERKPIPNSNLFYIEIDDFAIFWTRKNKLLLTHLSEILWLQQTI